MCSQGLFTHETESPWPLHFKHSHWWKRWGPVQVRFTLRWRDHRSMWMQDGCKVHMDSYVASNGSCLMVTWTLFQKSPLGGTSNTKAGNHGALNAHSLWFILFYHVWGLTWIESTEIAFGWGPGHIWLCTTLEDLWPHHMILKVSWDGPWTLLSFGLSQFHGHDSWLECEVALS